MNRLNRRTFLQIGLAVAASLTGCGGGATQTAITPIGGGSSSTQPTTTTTTSPTTAPLADLNPPLFASDPNPADLTLVGETPPTEIPNAQRFFGADPVFAGKTAVAKTGLDTFDHIVVIQFENRAFDHLLGYLYPSGKSPTGQPFNGVGDKSLSNPGPSGNVPVSKAPTLQTPFTDPAEQYPSVNLALYNQYNPASNQTITDESKLLSPYNLPNQGAFSPPPMNGFVTCFLWSLISSGYTSPTSDQINSIMQCFPPSLIPVMSQLAQNFAICDNWYCGVPSQTFCNRSFFNAASSAGQVDNSPTLKWTGFPFLYDGNTAPTIFDRLTAANRTWTIYSDAADIISLTRLIHYPTLKKYPFKAPYFKDMSQFYDDVESGSLPDYAYIEPRFFPFDNSYHPYTGAPAVKRGEILLNDISQAIRQSNSSSGSNFQNTLFIATFDEGGTCYDHVPPPAAVPPNDGYTTEDNFGFDRLGQRIPAILVSAYINAGTVINTPLQATSVMKTIEEKWKIPSINARDAASTSLAGVFNRTTPRSRAEWPRNRVRKLSADEAASDLGRPMHDEQSAIIRSVYGLQTGKDGMPPGVSTIGDALKYLSTAAGTI